MYESPTLRFLHNVGQQEGDIPNRSHSRPKPQPQSKNGSLPLNSSFGHRPLEGLISCETLLLHTCRFKETLFLPDLYKTGYKVFLPLYTSHPLDVHDPTIKRILIIIHGRERNARNYFCIGVSEMKNLTGTIVIAPWFYNRSIEETEWNSCLVSSTITTSEPSIPVPRSVCWSNERWMSGGDDTRSPPHYTTSFDCMDLILKEITKTNFPNLETIVISGFSAGAQLVMRYAFFSDFMNELHHDENKNIKIRVIVSDPSSYLYFDDLRPALACAPPRDTGPHWSCHQFQVPTNFQIKCPHYDNYKYGLKDVKNGSVSRVQNMYLEKFIGNSEKILEIVKKFPEKDIRWLFAVQDTCNCQVEGYVNPSGCFHRNTTCFRQSGNISDGPSLIHEKKRWEGDSQDQGNCCDTYPASSVTNSLDTLCEAMLQGSNRLQRGILFMNYMRFFFTGSSHVSRDFPRFDFYDGEHNGLSFLSSNKFYEWSLE
eukprot:TRINITY_DN7897_c0_g1_i4.p1 TRINITY_DN7897_c0_g1~~TRINITY_DN7897_c0_g1_i4.p1  ORF type:complete len:483 (+),score=62.67 TRINITY_DN7897_c0_g1_i4:320-1768(+)